MTREHPLRYRINPEMAFATFIRRAHKSHHCCGGHDGTKRTSCNSPIECGEQYVEYCGESGPYQSGKRYHMECAEQQGLVVKETAA